MPTITVVLSTLWINDARDLTQVESFPYLSALASAPTVGVTTTLYAGGNYRMLTTPGPQATLAVTLTAVTPSQRSRLEVDWLGAPLVVRDDRGRRFWCSYSSLQITEHQYDDECAVTLNLVGFSYSDAV